MKRYIQFRAWSSEKNEWLTQPVHLDSDGCIYPYTPDENKYDWNLDCTKIFVTQYTGENDKNNAKIFEGDICCNLYGRKNGGELQPSNIGFVEFRSGKFSVVKKVKYTERTLSGDPFKIEKTEWVMSLVDKNIEVIGNIYQNPDLL